ncbi:MAG: hypothetical protein AB7K68_16755 [Bacteriovoracia bacterium]
MALRNNKYLPFIAALLLSVLAGSVAGGLYFFREQYFDTGKSRAHGKFEPLVEEKLLGAATAYAEKKLRQPEQVCVTRSLGRDERYVYLAFGCAKFAMQYGEPRAYGDQGFRALRLRYWGNWIVAMDQGNPERLPETLRRLYPPELQDLWWKKTSVLEFIREGAKGSAP